MAHSSESNPICFLEMTSDKPSCCSSPSSPSAPHSQEESCSPKPSAPKASPSRYRPLFVLIALTFLAALAKQVHYPGWDGRSFMHDFMGLFLLCFSMLKLFDSKGFAEGFAKYDLLAKRSKTYALLYPFLELALALGYLARWQPMIVYLMTLTLMSFGAIGVLRSLSLKQNLTCACMGSSLNVPLSTVAVVENVGMVAMALLMLLF